MKYPFSLIICSVAFLHPAAASWSEENRRIEAEQVALWESKLAEAKQKPAATRPAELCLGLRNMGYRKAQDGHSRAVDEIYQRLQMELIAIPGHAQYFADRIERDRSALKPDQYRGDYDQRRAWHFETLVHLPSPETIQVLGRFLSDERDKPPPRIPGQDWSDLPGSCFVSMDALSRIGLRHPPVNERIAIFDAYNRDAVLSVNRAWWEEIKSGKRTFSFKGQSVEYRFKPDGTWETLAMANPPDDAPKPVAAAKPARNSQSPPVAVKPPPGNSWPWIIGAAMIGLAVVVWLGLRKSRADP